MRDLMVKTRQLSRKSGKAIGQSLAKPLTLSEALDTACTLPIGELAKLCRSIVNALPAAQCRVVQFASAYRNEGTGSIAVETAIAAAALLGKRVLFIDATERSGMAPSATSASTPALQLPALHTLLQQRTPPNEAVVKTVGNRMIYTVLRRYGESGTTLTTLDAVQGLIDSLRNSYDIIILYSPDLLKDIFAQSLSAVADGSVLVIEAERTRAPVAQRAKILIEENGGTIIGAVMSKRRYHIPRLFYRWI